MRRRTFVSTTASGVIAFSAAGALAAPKKNKTPDLKVGVCDWNLGAKEAAAFELAKKMGLDGVQVSPNGVAETLSYGTKEGQAVILKAMKDTGLGVASVGLNIANGNPIATDDRAVSWMIQTVDAAKAFGSTSTLLAFFGKGALKGKEGLKTAEIDSVVAKLKEVSPHAEKQGVALGLENTLSAKDNLAIMDRVGSDAVQVYYDIANSTGNGYDVPKELIDLKGRICEIHFKNSKGRFGVEGIDLDPIRESILKTGYKGWIVLERLPKGENKIEYFKANATYIRKIFGLKAPEWA